MISVLRLGHRVGRDPRISTHCGLVARALGASEIIYTGEHDKKLLDSIRSTVERWGGPFSVKYESSWKKCVAEYKKKGFKIVHLTMYGIGIEKEIKNLMKKKKVLLIIGSEKVPPEVYQMVDYNLAVGNQPHSEVAALAIFLHEYFRGKELGKKFKKSRIRIIGQERGKKIVEK